MNVAIVTADALGAARIAAGATWGQIQHNFAADLQGVAENAVKIEALLQAGAISEADANDMLKQQSLSLFILSQEVVVDGRVVAQNAINAAIDVFWAAIKTAAKL